MPPDSWSLLDEALAGALEQPEDNRLAWLRGELAAHPGVLLQAESMLARAAEAEAFFDRSPVAPFRLAPGARLGPWRLERELGRGGMGVVWLARRDDGQADMRAAIKLLNTPFATTLLLERFQREKQILARLNHPNIAGLLDAGIGPGDLPNFVLEYVDGEPITSHCTAHKLSLPARVRLARQILDGLQHAHSHLVVHRDLKPGNILCAAEGIPKLLDFGIARLVEDTGEQARTETLYRALSIDYASPEQIRGEPVSTSSDIYSFALVLYEMLTGERPRAWSRRPIGDVLIEAADFRLPAHPSLPADLRAILAKASDPEPARRYRTANDFSADLGRFLDGRPVEARAAGPWYFAARYLRRHAVAASAAALALAGILAAAGVALHQAREAESQRLLAVARLREAEGAAREAGLANARSQAALADARQQRQVADDRREDLLRLSYSFVDETYRDIANLPGATELRAKLLARTLEHLERLEASSSDEPALLYIFIEALGSLSDTYGGANANLGEREKAASLLRKRAALIERLGGLQPDTPDLRRLTLDNQLRFAVLDYAANRPQYTSRIRGLEPAFDRLAASAPPSRLLYRSAVTYYFHRARASVDNAEALRYYLRAGELAAEDERRFGGDESCWRSLALVHKYSAGMYTAASADFLRHIELAAAYDEKRVALNPANAQARMDLTFDRSSLATHFKATGDAARARGLLLEVYRQRSALVELDPRNEWFRNSLWYPLNWASIYALDLQDRAGVESGLKELESLAAHSTPPPYVLVSIPFLRGELALPANSAAACAEFRNARAAFARLTPAQQRAYGSATLIVGRLAACPAQSEEGSTPSREAP
jgi:tRNA A-37 threonylcarbamoyl transferase component Bud32